MFEHHREPLLSRAAFAARVARHALGFVGMIGAALGIGILGYHGFEGLSWIDALVNASMILGGMGPVSELHTNAGKLFASAYALFSGLLFVAAMGVLFAPVVHRLLHRFHVQADSEDSTEDS
jgi:NhaP-type Na+/H+ or K+/H+ antiporter